MAPIKGEPQKTWTLEEKTLLVTAHQDEGVDLTSKPAIKSSLESPCIAALMAGDLGEGLGHPRKAASIHIYWNKHSQAKYSSILTLILKLIFCCRSSCLV